MVSTRKQLSPSKRKSDDDGRSTVDAHYPARKPGRTQAVVSKKPVVAGKREQRGLGPKVRLGNDKLEFVPARTLAKGGKPTAAAKTLAKVQLFPAAPHAKKKAGPAQRKASLAAKTVAPEEKQQGTERRAANRRTAVESVEIDNVTFHTGDSVYVVLDDSAIQGLSDDEEEEACATCGEVDRAGVDMLECGRCLRGFHLCCLDPPLDAVPEDDWVCPDCEQGRPVPAQGPTTARSRVLTRAGLALARIEALWAMGGGAHAATLRWYCLPEETHAGRQTHHAAREVFLTSTRDLNEVTTLLRHAHVLPSPEFRHAPPELGDDVFLCDYEYNEAWQRFRRRPEYGPSESEDEGDDWRPEAEADEANQEGDAGLHCKSVYAMWAEKGLVPPKNLRGYGTANPRPSRQGGKDLLGVVGRTGADGDDLAVAAAARARALSACPLARARDALAPSAAPRRLPCREAERAAVESFVESVLDADQGPGCSGRCLYISGIPGTGKTATVLEVMRSARQRVESGEVPAFRFVEINGLRLASPQHAYCALHEALTGERLGPSSAAAALERMFCGGAAATCRSKSAPPKRPVIVLVDELDLLVNRAQTVLYNLFDWPSRPGSRLSIIGIANTMDLPERLHPRIGSRLAGRRITFQPYNREQLETILRARLEGIDAFDPNALVFVSRKVANCSGDIRLALEICRRAAEITELDSLEGKENSQADANAESSVAPGAASPTTTKPARVSMAHVDRGIRAALSGSAAQRAQQGTPLERLLLAAVHLETRFGGRAEVGVGAVLARLRSMLSAAGQEPVATGAALEAGQALAAARLLLCDAPARRLKARVVLNMPAPELLYVLTADEEMPWLAALLGAGGA